MDDILRDSRGDARYFVRQWTQYITFWATYTRAIFRGTISRVASCITQNIVRRRDYRSKYGVPLCVLCVLLDERRVYRWNYPDSVQSHSPNHISAKFETGPHGGSLVTSKEKSFSSV